MKVRLKDLWFGPSEVANEGKLNQVTGRRYRPGVHFFPPEMKALLPKSAVILEDDTPVPEPVKGEPGSTLRDFDEARAAADRQDKVEQEAEQERLRLRAEQMKRELEGEDEAPVKKAKKKG